MEYTNCISCESDESSFYKKFKDPFKSYFFNLVKCNNCGLIYLNPRPNSNEISKYYNSLYLPHRRDKSPFLFIYSIAQKITFFWKYKLILKYSPLCKKVLDYGGGNGSFSNYLNKLNINAVNYDPNISSKLKISDYVGNQKFNVITLWHSMEHIHEVNSAFKYIPALLDGNGVLIIAIPNHDAYERKAYYKDNWIAYDVPRHLYHFTFDTFQQLIEKHSFYIESYYPMYQDTFFNILMSFKGKNPIKLIHHIVITLVHIYRNKKLSSSLLFICKKKYL